MKLDEKQLIIIAIAVGVVAVIMSCAAIGIAVSNGNDDSPVTVFDWKVTSVKDYKSGGYFYAMVTISCAGDGVVHVYYDNGMDIGSLNVTGGKHSYGVILHRSDSGLITIDGIIGVK